MRFIQKLINRFQTYLQTYTLNFG